MSVYTQGVDSAFKKNCWLVGWFLPNINFWWQTWHIKQPQNQPTYLPINQPGILLFGSKLCNVVKKKKIKLFNYPQVMAPCSLEFRQTYDVEKAVREMSASLSSVKVFVSATVMAMAWDLVGLMQPSSQQVHISLSCCCWGWSLLCSAIYSCQADSLHSYVILHEWIAFRSAFLNSHWGVHNEVTEMFHGSRKC